MLFIFIILTPLLIAPTTVTGQHFFKGGCPKHIQAMPNFDFQKYKGLWFEVEKYMFLPEITGKCVYVRYLDLQPDGVSFKADIVQIKLGTNKRITSPSDGKLVSTDGSAQINLNVNVLIPLTNITGATFKYPYWILETDYDDYSIKWACEEFKLLSGSKFNMQSIWILGRTQNYPEDLRRYVHERLSEFGLKPEKLILTDQTSCPRPATDDYLNEPTDSIPPPLKLIPVPLRVLNFTETNIKIMDMDNSQE